jgi:hypothetical protein
MFFSFEQLFCLVCLCSVNLFFLVCCFSVNGHQTLQTLVSQICATPIASLSAMLKEPWTTYPFSTVWCLLLLFVTAVTQAICFPQVFSLSFVLSICIPLQCGNRETKQYKGKRKPPYKEHTCFYCCFFTPEEQGDKGKCISISLSPYGTTIPHHLYFQCTLRMHPYCTQQTDSHVPQIHTHMLNVCTWVGIHKERVVRQIILSGASDK